MEKCKIFHHSCQNLPHEATSRVSKKFSRRQIKNLFLTKVAHCSRDEKKYIWHGHRTYIGFGNHKKLKKKQKVAIECPFEIIGFICWLKIPFLFPSISKWRKKMAQTSWIGQMAGGFLDFMVSVIIFARKAAQLMCFTLEKPSGA